MIENTQLTKIKEEPSGYKISSGLVLFQNTWVNLFNKLFCLLLPEYKYLKAARLE